MPGLHSTVARVKSNSFCWELLAEMLWSALEQEPCQTAKMELERSQDKLSLPQPQEDG